MPDVRLAVDLDETSEIGRFHYLIEPQSRILPGRGERVAIDPGGQYEMEVVAITASYDEDEAASHILWGQPRFSLPLEPETIWDFGFRPAWFESFQLGDETLSASELFARLESREAWHQRRQKAANATVALALAVGGAALWEAHEVAEHVIQLGWNDLIAVAKTLQSKGQ